MYQKIYSSSLKLLYPHTSEKTYATIVKEAIKLVGAIHGSLFLIDNGKLQRVYTTLKALNKTIPRKRGHTWKAYVEQKPSILVYKYFIKLHPELTKFRFGSDIVMPLAYNDKAFGVLSVISDVTKIFTKRELSILQMFSPLASLALRNTQLYSEVMDSLREQDLFISMAAHELKTPLTTVSIYAQLLLREDNKINERQQKEKMLHEIQRLTNLVNELLQVSQIKKGRLQYVMKKCNIYDIIEQAVANFQNAHKHKVRFKNQIRSKLAFVKGDPDKLTQVISNLLTNAAKFSMQNTQIEVTLSREISNIQIKIRDHGIGINAKDLPRIFEGYYKASLMKKEGLGLGLYVVKNIIDYHKGTISVTSIPNKGTIFFITLPLYRQ